jgi:hypothetical protein
MNQYTTHLHQFVAGRVRGRPEERWTVFSPNVATLIQYRRLGFGIFGIRPPGAQLLRRIVSAIAEAAVVLGKGTARATSC